VSESNATRLTLRLEGGSADQGRLPLPELLRVGSQVHAVLRDVATVLARRSSGQPGRVKKFIEAATELEVVAAPRPGSFVLDLELPETSTALDGELEGFDLEPHLGHQALGALVTGINALDDSATSLPPGFDRGVLRAIAKFRPTMTKGISRITLELAGNGQSQSTTIDDGRIGAVRRLIKQPVKGPAVVEGKLQMVDVGRLECRVDRVPRPSVSCLFPEHLRDDMLAAITKYVRVSGEGEFQPDSDEPSRIVVSSLVIVHEVLGLDPTAFGQPKSIEELAAERGVGSAQPLLKVGDEDWRDDDEAADWIRAAKSDA
jgi:hypothetical protein